MTHGDNGYGGKGRVTDLERTGTVILERGL